MTDTRNVSLGELVSDMETPLRDAANLAHAAFALVAYQRGGLDQNGADALAAVVSHIMDDLKLLTEAWERSFDSVHRPAAAA